MSYCTLLDGVKVGGSSSSSSSISALVVLSISGIISSLLLEGVKVSETMQG